MKLTRAAEYAIRCMTYLAQKGVGTLISKQDIAEQADIPSHFLAKIAQDLAKAGLMFNDNYNSRPATTIIPGSTS